MEAEAREILAKACEARSAVSGEAVRKFVNGLYRGQKPGRVVEGLLSERRREAAAEKRK
jgi:hypothetical protein